MLGFLGKSQKLFQLDEDGQSDILQNIRKLENFLNRNLMAIANVFRYLMFTLDQFVEQDYSLVYFHYGLTSKNRPSLSWLWQAYRAFDRKYKKNLKALYLVHPTNFIRLLWQLFKAAIR
jgi:hypothetical protein